MASSADLGGSGLVNLGSWTIAQLRDLAQRIGLGGYSRMDKKGLLDAVNQALPKAESSAVLTPEHTPEESSAAALHAPIAPELTSHVTFLPRDPQWAYVFWEIRAGDQQRAAAAGGTQLALRVADVTGLPLGAAHPHTLQELVVNSGAREWHLPMPLSDRDYRVELGYRTKSGGWFSLATSSVARMPALEPSAFVADAFVPFSLDAPIAAMSATALSSGGVEHERMYQLSTATAVRSRRVGSEVLHEWDQNLARSGELNDSGAGLWASGLSESGSGIVRPRSFWLVADAELIVYGATEPTASLSIGDQEIPLEADGTFRVHVPFRDGEQLYPIRAVAADGEQERSIRLEFERRTPAARVNRKEDAVLEWF
ncbi:MAG: DUF4912 domain-containing protein [Vulcanococcus sp.]|uniref:DUF4912 domain-containing protein n=1 Tax=Vulcanococcus sp. TaxID=2856995 RepID=UPI0025FC0AEE|nr:DUF4912 domain-containing protein [Vulcanococcus sp.]MBW0182080.1 DUF4912 domain-containing protein [Vulcanococcus sp.]